MAAHSHGSALICSSAFRSDTKPLGCSTLRLGTCTLARHRGDLWLARFSWYARRDTASSYGYALTHTRDVHVHVGVSDIYSGFRETMQRNEAVYLRRSLQSQQTLLVAIVSTVAHMEACTAALLHPPHAL